MATSYLESLQPSDNSVRCHICGKRFASNSKLTKHLNTTKHKLFIENLRQLHEEVVDPGEPCFDDGNPDDELRVYPSESDYSDDECLAASDSDENVFVWSDNSVSDDEDIDTNDTAVELLNLNHGDGHDQDMVPFHSATEALFYVVMNSQRPISEQHLKFIWHIFTERNPYLLPFYTLKRIKLPGCIAPEKAYSLSGKPFFINSIVTILKMCLADRCTAAKLIRAPQDGSKTYGQLYQAHKWNSDPCYQAPMIKVQHNNFFVLDIIQYEDPLLKKTIGRIERFFYDAHGVLCALVTRLVTSEQLAVVMSISLPLYADNTYHYILDAVNINVSWIYSTIVFDGRILRLPSGSNPLYEEFNYKEMKDFLAPSIWKLKYNGSPVLICPLIMFTDDFSGNTTKQWNKFDCWEVILAALPKEDNAKFRNIHFVCASNRLTFLEMADEIVKQLLLLEEGVLMYDAFWDEDVYVVAPLFCFIADNPRHSEITSHLTGSPRKYCRLCLSDRLDSPTVIGKLRSKDDMLVYIDEIKSAKTVKEQNELKTKYGVNDAVNPLYQLNVDIIKCTPIESLHTILLGPYKYLLRKLMSKLSKMEKSEISSKVTVFPWSGFESKLKVNICTYTGSLVGRNFKIIAQMAMYLFRSYLLDCEAQAWLYLSKIFKMCYIDEVDPSKKKEYREICDGFVESVAVAFPEMLKKIKVHLLLHLPSILVEYGPISGYNTERCESFNSLIRCKIIHSNRQSPSRDLAVKFSVIENINFITARPAMDGKRCGNDLVKLYRSPEVRQYVCGEIDPVVTVEFKKIMRDKHKVVTATLGEALTYKAATTSGSLLCGSQNLVDGCNLSSIPTSALVKVYHCMTCIDGCSISTGACIEAIVNTERYIGILVSCLEACSELSTKMCYIRLFEEIQIDDICINNEFDCPLYYLTTTVMCMSPGQIKRSVSVLHQCDTTCHYIDKSLTRTIEREEITDTSKKLLYVHNYLNNIYFLNIFCK